MLCILFLSGQVFSQSLSDLSFGTDGSFEVVTWNIEFFPKQGNVTRDSVREIIKALDVDIIGLQEIEDTTDFREVLEDLPDYELYIVDGYYNGLAYVCKKSTIKVNALYKIYDSSGYWNVLPRSPVVMEFTYNGEEMIIINNHYKCCGDGDLEVGNFDDEEGRRYAASELIKEYIDANFDDSNVILVGDLNDNIVDVESDNVFQMFIDDSDNYAFVDEAIANGTSAFWSYPNWPSHLDHILITNELFDEVDESDAVIETFRIGDFMVGGFNSYDNKVSDHRPVGMKIKVGAPVSTFDQLLQTSISINPNPNNGAFSVDLTSMNDDVELKIINVLNEAVFTNEYSGEQVVEVEFDGASGLYFLIVTSEDQKGISRFIKK
jgi:endonuclease/exonuclease/phosphatase family metal-dependent hydrolase